MITVTHNGDDITDSIDTSSFSINDERNDTRDTLSFAVDRQPGGFKPLLNAEIIVTLDSVRIFGGSIVSIETSVEAPPAVRFEVECIDFTRELDRRLVTERFSDETVADIIDFIITKYTTGFTQVGVTVTQNVSAISFNRLTVSECLEKIARLNEFSWYVDYNKDIHFFARSDEEATSPHPE